MSQPELSPTIYVVAVHVDENPRIAMATRASSFDAMYVESMVMFQSEVSIVIYIGDLVSD